MKKKLSKLLKIGITTALLSSCLLFTEANGIESPFSPVSVEAATVTKYTTTANVNLRSKNTTKSKIILTIPKGKQVTYIKKSGSWYKVKYKGKTGWVKKTYIKKSKVKNVKTKTVYKTTANLNLRSKKSKKGKVILTIPKGKEVTYIKKSGSWYKVKYKGKTGWVSAKYIKKIKKVISTAPNKNSNSDTNKNTTKKPTTKLPDGQKITKMTVYTAVELNLRKSDSNQSDLLVKIPKNTKLTTDYKTKNKWYKVTYKGKTGFVSGSYLIDQNTKDRIKRLEKNKDSYIFMDLRTKSSVTAEQINKYIQNRVGNERSVLKNTGKYFIDAGDKYGVNALYLAAHAIHESDFGRSNISLDRYNLFGYGAFDLVPYLGSVKFPSIKDNIYFIAQKMKATYLGNSYLNKGTYLGYSVKSITGVRIDELSKGMNFYYATGSTWGENIAKHMNNILDYSKEKAKNRKPNTTVPANPSYPNGADVFPDATLAFAKSTITLYNLKSTSAVAGKKIKKGDYFNLLEKDNNYWLKVKYKDKTYYAKVQFNAYNKYFTVKNLGRIASKGVNVNFRKEPSTSGEILGTVKHKSYIQLVLNKDLKPITKNGYYKVIVNKKTGWVSKSYVVHELSK